MPLWVYILLGIVVVRVGWGIYRRMSKKNQAQVQSPNEKDIEQKKKHLDQIVGYLGQNDQVDSAKVQSMLNVSPATAGRYLEELQSQGKIVQVGDIGQGVYYKKA